MPSSLHEQIVELLRESPECIALMLAAQGLQIPPGATPEVKDANFSIATPVEFRADLVVLFGEPEPSLALVVEAQLQEDEKKLFSWPVYLTVLRSQYRCRAAVMVIAPDRAVARWASQPIDLGNGGCVVPMVVGHGTMPRITDVESARKYPPLAMLCAIIYGKDPDSVELVPASHHAAALLDADGKGYYHDLLYSVFNEAARQALEAIMNLPENYEYQFPPWREAQRKGREEGKAQEAAAILLRALHARGIMVPDQVRARIETCTDLDTLHTWFDRALAASSIEEVVRD